MHYYGLLFLWPLLANKNKYLTRKNFTKNSNLFPVSLKKFIVRIFQRLQKQEKRITHDEWLDQTNLWIGLWWYRVIGIIIHVIIDYLTLVLISTSSYASQHDASKIENFHSLFDWSCFAISAYDMAILLHVLCYRMHTCYHYKVYLHYLMNLS